MSLDSIPNGSKKEEFQKYLERNGVVEALAKVLVGLYEVPERPNNPLEFIKEYLGAPVAADVDRLNAMIETQQRTLAEKDQEITQLKQQIETLQASQPTGTAP